MAQADRRYVQRAIARWNRDMFWHGLRLRWAVRLGFAWTLQHLVNEGVYDDRYFRCIDIWRQIYARR